MPPGYYDYYGIPRPKPAEEAVQANRPGLNQGPPIPRGLLEYYGIVPRAASDSSPSPVQQKEETQTEPLLATEPKTPPVDATEAPASAEPMAVQAKSDGSASKSEAERVHEAAAHGTSGPAGVFPYLDVIQRSFGGHNVSHVKAHTDGQAAAGAREMGAEAFTVGDHVAFAGTPSLYTAAHEAAHVIQQRAGVQLKGSLGEVGDQYERHADAVADLVVQGKSAEVALDMYAGSSPHHLRTQVQRKEQLPEGEKGFSEMWKAHPHNYQTDEGQNTSSEDLLNEEGLPSWIANTCAVRLSVMLNKTGHEITPQKTAAAGIKRKPTYSKKTKQYYILAASEMREYLAKNFRKADLIFPATGQYKDQESFQTAFNTEIKPIVSARKGVAAFETIFGYSGTGHVDIFDGESLSDAPAWYPCQKLHLWYVVVP